MRVAYFGHAAVGLQADSGTRLVVDPYESGALGGAIAYESIPWSPEYVVCTHGHDDHSAVDALEGPEPKRIDEGECGPFEVRRFSFDHDEYDGERFGGRVDALRIDCGAHSFVHLSDVGQSPAGTVSSALRGADVAFFPTGGFYTIGAAQAWEWTRRLSPRAVVPIHYASDACDLPLHPVDAFLAHAKRIVTPDRSRIDIPHDLPEQERTVVALRPKCLPTD